MRHVDDIRRMLTRIIDRRRALGLGAALLAGPAAAQSAANQWFALKGDDGHPVPNGRVPVELAEEIEDLPGAIWAGPKDAAVTLVEFYDLNCPWCRGSARAVEALRRINPDLRLGLVNNAILSPGSAQAAKVQLALMRMKDARAAHELRTRLYEQPSRVDGSKALDAAAALGADRSELERLANGSQAGQDLRRQMALAASIGLVATPSYVVGGASVLGWPGETTLARIVANARPCGPISC